MSSVLKATTATEALSDCIEYIGVIYLSVCLSTYLYLAYGDRPHAL